MRAFTLFMIHFPKPKTSNDGILILCRTYRIPVNPRKAITVHNSDDAMGAFLEKPQTEKSNESGEGVRMRYGVSAMQGLINQSIN